MVVNYGSVTCREIKFYGKDPWSDIALPIPRTLNQVFIFCCDISLIIVQKWVVAVVKLY